ncbi:Uncharacterised protein [Legionella donaldsonii]|uniref:Uncharacterized protein n=1 Tax=Legionella donaldsonii TaxID=45060 RepID=A0A378J1K9_9GAMM|nr:hypothetical protein [Legionella donaldsonii]STX41495.1 Uncharacterised protein [Legionella donaldsonii]
MNKKYNYLDEHGKKISKKQFDAYCYCRRLSSQLFEEIEWYSFFENRILAVIVRDFIDDDYGYVILGRDENRLFRCIDLSKKFSVSADICREELLSIIHSQYESSVQDCYPQGNNKKRKIDLFKECIPKNKQHKFFKILAQEPRFEAARNLISEITNSFIDKDGHYVREFQSENFHARLWELYLHMYFNHNVNLLVSNEHTSPDFELSYFGEKFFVEAVTVNPSTNPQRPDPPTSKPADIQKNLKNFMPIKFGSTLLSKLTKKYWEKNHVKNHPLVFAIHDYHTDDSMTWSRVALAIYLYGLESKIEDGVSTLYQVPKHKWKGKKIESGFFFNSQYSKYISGVLFSNQATLTKFNRMGKLAGLGSSSIKMIRMSFLLDDNPNALLPLMEYKDIDASDYEESWSEGLVIYHNPNALFPLNINAFNDICNVFYDNEVGLIGFNQSKEVLNSFTFVVQPK